MITKVQDDEITIKVSLFVRVSSTLQQRPPELARASVQTVVYVQTNEM